MSKRLAFAVATAAELSAVTDAIYHPSPEASTRKATPEESKTTAPSTPPPFDSDSDADDAAPSSPSPSSPSPDLISLPPLPPRPSSRASAPDPPPTLPLRHRLSLYVDSCDDSPPEVFTTAFSPDSKLLAAGCGDGSLRVYSSQGQLRYRFDPVTVDALPITCVRFRPAAASAFSALQGVLLATSADGTVSHYHLSPNSAKASSVLRSDASNQLYTAAYDPLALTFATAGRDATLRVYDEQTRQLTASLPPLSSASPSSSGHSNRVYALRYHPTQPHVLFSAGWDNTVLVWDVRVRRTSAVLYGPHVCGDALDVHPDGRRLLTGSWRQTGAVEVWDWVGGRVMEGVAYNGGSEAGGGGKAEMLYAATWGGGEGEWMAAGGCGSNDAKVRRTGAGDRWEERVTLKGGVYSVSFSPDGSKMAVAGADANMIVVDM